jgi:Amt family ammonium transporter
MSNAEFSAVNNIEIGHQVGVAIGAFSAVYTVAVTFALLKLVGAITPLRVTADEEAEGLDVVLHNESGYNL